MYTKKILFTFPHDRLIAAVEKIHIPFPFSPPPSNLISFRLNKHKKTYSLLIGMRE